MSKQFSSNFILGLISTGLIASACITTQANAENYPVLSFEYDSELNKKFETEYGSDEKKQIEGFISKEITRLSSDKIGKITIKINDVTPNTLTRQQMFNTDLRMESYGRGGISITAKTYDKSGAFIKDVSYDYTSFGGPIYTSNWEWADAKYGAYRFAKKVYEN